MIKTKTIFILVTLVVSIISPLTVHISVSLNGTFLLNLDVCSAAGHALSTNQDMPYLYENQFRFPVLVFTDLVKDSNPSFNPVLIAFQKEHPPRV